MAGSLTSKMTKNADLIDRINKEVGDPDALQYGTSERFVPKYLSTGIRNLDSALGGGLRKGSFVLLTGEFSRAATYRGAVLINGHDDGVRLALFQSV